MLGGVGLDVTAAPVQSLVNSTSVKAPFLDSSYLITAKLKQSKIDTALSLTPKNCILVAKPHLEPFPSDSAGSQGTSL